SDQSTATHVSRRALWAAVALSCLTKAHTHFSLSLYSARQRTSFYLRSGGRHRSISICRPPTTFVLLVRSTETTLSRLASPIWRSGSPSVGKECAPLRRAAS